jgi:hypothetical protein
MSKLEERGGDKGRMYKRERGTYSSHLFVTLIALPLNKRERPKYTEKWTKLVCLDI